MYTISCGQTTRSRTRELAVLNLPDFSAFFLVWIAISSSSFEEPSSVEDTSSTRIYLILQVTFSLTDSSKIGQHGRNCVLSHWHILDTVAAMASASPCCRLSSREVLWTSQHCCDSSCPQLIHAMLSCFQMAWNVYQEIHDPGSPLCSVLSFSLWLVVSKSFRDLWEGVELIGGVWGLLVAFLVLFLRVTVLVNLLPFFSFPGMVEDCWDWCQRKRIHSWKSKSAWNWMLCFGSNSLNSAEKSCCGHKLQQPQLAHDRQAWSCDHGCVRLYHTPKCQFFN